MIIVNADDWGRTCAETDAALLCYKEGRITSVTAMVFMEDSERAADIARDAGIDVGLHLNLSQRFTGEVQVGLLQKYHNRIVQYLTLNKYTFLFYNPVLRKQFRYVYQAQLEEFLRLYGRAPSHIDGHHHMHLCANILIDRIIPNNEKVRRNFSFWPGEKSFLNRMYRRVVDRWLDSRYFVTDYFFALPQILQTNRLMRVLELSKVTTVELMTHPFNAKEYDYLMSDDYLAMLSKIENGTYSSI